MTWVTLGRPGYFGKKRDEIHEQYNQTHGKDNWRIMWRWGKEGQIILPFTQACMFYEDAYFIDSFKRETLWLELKVKAKEVYDYDQTDMASGLDYLIQKGPATHVQDIAIRNIFFRRGWAFEGQDILQIRRHETYWGSRLSPGKVPFHIPNMIVQPHLEKWWDYNSVEDFYQSNKIIQVKEKVAKDKIN